MKKVRFTETQIISVLKRKEAGISVKDLAREHGISEATFYNWKSKYGGMEANEVRRMKDLEEENNHLILNIIDDYNRESLWIEIDTSLPSRRVIRVLDRLLEMRGKPIRIRVDNGPEIIRDLLKQWCEEHNIELLFIQPGKPVQNAFIERDNGSLRRELLDAYLFLTLQEVRQMAEEWQ